MCAIEGHIALHYKLVEPWSQLVAAAKKEGFALALASGFRSFERQSLIWNAKLSGSRPVLDDQGSVLDIAALSPLERVERVMRWSALPGTSRHHWGTDMDIYDSAAIPDSYQLQLIPSEYTDGGPFAPMMEWLHRYLQQDQSPDFFFPYLCDRGGVIPEPWHLSYRPLAEQFQQEWSLDSVAELIRGSDLLEKDTVLEHLDSLYKKYIHHSIHP